MAAMVLVRFREGLARLGMSGSTTARRTAPFCGGPQKSARAAAASELACALSPGAIMELPSGSQTGEPLKWRKPTATSQSCQSWRQPRKWARSGGAP